MAGNRLYFAVQAGIFYRGTQWDALEKLAKDDAGPDGAPNYTPATHGLTLGTAMEPSDLPYTPYTAHGVQDVSLTSNFTLTPVFELGQAAVYENLEGIPTVEITLSKAIDGKPLLWHLATLDAPTPTLMGRTASYCTFQLALWPDTEERCFYNGTGSYNDATGQYGMVTGTDRSVMPIGVITMPKCFPSNLGYTINVTDMATENLSLSGNEKVWARAHKSVKPLPDGSQSLAISEDIRFCTAFADFQGNDDTPDHLISRGHNVMMKPAAAMITTDANGMVTATAGNADQNGAVTDPDCSVFPIEIPGISMAGTNDVEANINIVEGPGDPDPKYARIQSVSFSVALTRNDVSSLGYKMPVFKSVQLPIAVTTEIAVHATTDDGIQVSSFAAACANTSSLRNSTIRLALCNGEDRDEDDAIQRLRGIRIYTGMKNKLTSVGMSGGNTQGGNVVNTYSYSTNNEFTVLADADPNEHNMNADGTLIAAGAEPGSGGWWNDRKYWVCN